MNKLSFRRGIPVLFALLVGGASCAPGSAAFEAGAQAELKGAAPEALKAYQEVCAGKSELCAMARTRVFRMHLKAGWTALREERYREAQAAFDRAVGVEVDDDVKKTARLGLAVPELVSGVAFEAARELTDKAQALTAMEAIAVEPSAVAPKAAAWINENRPALLLARLKAACKAGGEGSCAELGATLSKLHPDTDAAREGQSVVAENEKRLWPMRKDAENLLIQRAGLHEHEARVDLCTKETDPKEESPTTAQECSDKITTGPVASKTVLEDAWTKKLATMDDPAHRRPLEERWKKAALGEYDAEPLPKP